MLARVAAATELRKEAAGQSARVAGMTETIQRLTWAIALMTLVSTATVIVSLVGG